MLTAKKENAPLAGEATMQNGRYAGSVAVSQGVGNPGATRDFLTILKLPTSLLVIAKTWRTDGTVKAYDDAKYFVHKEVAVDGIASLSAVLSQLEHNARACVIRGKYVGHDKAAERDPEFKHGKVRRIADLYDDVPHHWLLAEIDNFEPLCADPVAQPVMAIEEFIATHLPACFQGVAYHWQLSNGAGHAKNVGKLKAHVWFWLANPPDVVLAASKDYQTEQDRVLQFINEECETGQGQSARLGDLYLAYSNWCKTSGIHPLAKVRFAAELERCVPFYAKFDDYGKGEEGKRRKFVAIRGLKISEVNL